MSKCVTIAIGALLFGDLALAGRLTPSPWAGNPDAYVLVIPKTSPKDRDMVKGIYRQLRKYRNDGESSKSHTISGSYTKVKFACNTLSNHPAPSGYDASSNTWNANCTLTSYFRIRGTDWMSTGPLSTEVGAVGTLIKVQQRVAIEHILWAEGPNNFLLITILPVIGEDSPQTILLETNLKATTTTEFKEATSSHFDFSFSGSLTDLSSKSEFNVDLSKITSSKKMRLYIFGNPAWTNLGGLWMQEIGTTQREIGFGADFVIDALYDFQRTVVETEVRCTHTFKAWLKSAADLSKFEGMASGSVTDTTSCTATNASFLANVHFQATPATVTEFGQLESAGGEPVGQHYRHYFHVNSLAGTVGLQDYFASFGNWGLSVTSAAGHAAFPFFDVGTMQQGSYTPYYREVLLTW